MGMSMAAIRCLIKHDHVRDLPAKSLRLTLQCLYDIIEPLSFYENHVALGLDPDFLEGPFGIGLRDFFQVGEATMSRRKSLNCLVFRMEIEDI